ncbi:hypothetical protein R5R35_001202 [Gryllus longicercus]|uniref:Uncharacterized protein n=1 Tax=Gryllus longicercus TaxID=2509291 RepID=A0AAN9W216_9ORTH
MPPPPSPCSPPSLHHLLLLRRGLLRHPPPSSSRRPRLLWHPHHLRRLSPPPPPAAPLAVLHRVIPILVASVRPASACERCVAGIVVNAVFCFASTTVAYSHPASISACSRPRHCANGVMSCSDGSESEGAAAAATTASQASLQEQLLQALLDDRFEEFRDLLHNVAVDPAHKYGKPHFGTALEVACRHRGRAAFVKELLTRVKPNVNHVVPEPVHHAAARGNVEALELLLKDKRTKVNAQDSAGRTALHHAARNFPSGGGEEAARFERCLALLLAHPDADADRPSHKGFSALHEAAAGAPGGADAVRALLARAPRPLDLDGRRGGGQRCSVRDTVARRFPELLGELDALQAAAAADGKEREPDARGHT